MTGVRSLRLWILLGTVGLAIGISACGGGEREDAKGEASSRSARGDAAQPTTVKSNARSLKGGGQSRRSAPESGHAGLVKPSGGKAVKVKPRLPDRVQEPIRLSRGQVKDRRLRAGFQASDKRLRRANRSAPDGNR